MAYVIASDASREDACAFSPRGRIFRAKVPSTPQDQSIGVKNSIDKIRAIIEAEEGFTGKFGVSDI
ncbi:hypothetical protein LTR42_002346 [Elasticomyces elasticus]|nr:hypothetical protein LTR42_002346 [Elasticomyces elasticus]